MENCREVDPLFESIKLEAEPVRDMIVNILLRRSKAGEFKIDLPPEDEMRKGVVDFHDSLSGASGLGFARGLGELPEAPADDFVRKILSEKFMPMLYMEKIRFGFEPEKNSGKPFVPKYPNLVIPSLNATDEISRRLMDSEYKILCSYAAIATKLFFERALKESTEGHLDLYHGRDFPTKRDLYRGLLQEAIVMMKDAGSKDVSFLRKEYPIHGF